MLRAGKTVTVRLTVGNEGGADVDGTYRVSLFLDGDLLKEDAVSDEPAAGEDTVVTFSGVRIPELSSGNHVPEATVDTYAAIPEPDEANNTHSINVKVK
jgi:subtilase family serine protease